MQNNNHKRQINESVCQVKLFNNLSVNNIRKNKHRKDSCNLMICTGIGTMVRVWLKTIRTKRGIANCIYGGYSGESGLHSYYARRKCVIVYS